MSFPRAHPRKQGIFGVSVSVYVIVFYLPFYFCFLVRGTHVAMYTPRMWLQSQHCTLLMPHLTSTLLSPCDGRPKGSDSLMLQMTLGWSARTRVLCPSPDRFLTCIPSCRNVCPRRVSVTHRCRRRLGMAASIFLPTTTHNGSCVPTNTHISQDVSSSPCALS